MLPIRLKPLQRFLKRLADQAAEKLPAPGGKAWHRLQIGVVSYGIFLVLYSTVIVTSIAVTHSITKAQSLQDRVDAARREAVMSNQVSEIEKRITTLEQLNLDRRLTVIETLLKELNSNTFWGPASMGGVGILILKEVYMALGRKRKGRQDDDD